jgi:hypothetical protein
MLPSLILVALAQALAITAVPTKLSTRVAYVPDDDLPAKYLAYVSHSIQIYTTD